MSKAAFDPIAQGYDVEFTHTLTGQYQRARVYDFMDILLKTNNIQHILELNCGTGEDALWLAQKGCNVLATDISAEMVNTAVKKANANHQGQQIQGKQIKIEDIGQLKQEAPFDLIFSNFGGLNCVSPEALEESVHSFNSLLRPGGHVVLVVMSRFCWWETLYFLAKGQWKKAWRRRSKTPVVAPLGNGITVDTWYYSPGNLIQLFKNHFEAKGFKPVGCFLPPSYLDPAFKTRPGILNGLNRIEALCPNNQFFSATSDHYMIHFNRKD